MAYKAKERKPPILALNAIRVLTPSIPLPAAVVPYERDALHTLLDREDQDVFAIRHGASDMAVIPLVADAKLPGKRQGLPAHENLSLVSVLERVMNL